MKKLALILPFRVTLFQIWSQTNEVCYFSNVKLAQALSGVDCV